MKLNPRANRYRNFTQLGDDLLAITKGCRPDMHEPDEQGVSAHITGKTLDNAGFEHELHVVITNHTTGTKDVFNLAELVAMARVAALAPDLHAALCGTNDLNARLRKQLAAGKKVRRG
jgi:hypothetical protein